LSVLHATPIIPSVAPVSDFDRIAPYLALWHGYDPSVKAELCSTCLLTSDGAYLVDPIPLQREAFDKLFRSSSIAGIVVTNSNHCRASICFADQFSAPLFARRETFLDAQPRQFRRVADAEEICDGLRVIAIEGAAAGEIILHYAPDGGTFIVGDALINFEPYGFTFLPGKYCSNEKEMRRSLRKLLDYKAERIFFAHGTPILSGASERLQGLLGSDL
jgi:glyoxylase-like metal-dependent hydrolase (beta-lactamase superfamily II)